ncbi:hypothetical protein [Modestobacter versicolor]|uniref:Uncharacterized protein n=1 Tax=Modestobacter versicolor TaxID=429133 RepID=A0A323VEN4_9ACTN|nr:hypothetical protein [Modestobacter versicolor]MBB3674339.1 hypothetical protein [Modestobacter versicolor]PZA23115.1 hypothetical protein DMO24_01745 [Modestobacter versicolor]
MDDDEWVDERSEETTRRPLRSLMGRTAIALAEWLLKPAIHALVALLALGALSPWIAVGISRVNPTCSDHPGYVAVNVATMLRDGSASASPRPSEARAEGRRDGRWAFDGRATAAWAWPVPTRPQGDVEAALTAAAADAKPIATLTIDFRQQLRDVALVCVVNGAPLDPASYVRADRAERVTVRTSCSSTGASTVLRSQGGDHMYDAQRLPTRCRDFSSLTLEVMSTYPGQYISEPSNGEIVAPTGLVAIAEVYLYRPVGASSPDYSRAAAMVHWVYTHPWSTVLGAVAAVLLVLAVTRTARATLRRG